MARIRVHQGHIFKNRERKSNDLPCILVDQKLVRTCEIKGPCKFVIDFTTEGANVWIETDAEVVTGD